MKTKPLTGRKKTPLKDRKQSKSFANVLAGEFREHLRAFEEEILGVLGQCKNCQLTLSWVPPGYVAQGKPSGFLMGLDESMAGFISFADFAQSIMEDVEDQSPEDTAHLVKNLETLIKEIREHWDATT